jgi:hypothetical protein
MFLKGFLAAALSLVPMCAPTPSSPSESVLNHINGATYSYNDAGPAVEAFRAVTAHRGWSTNATAAWEPFVTSVIRKESGFCYNLRRGARLASGPGCVISRQGTGSDSGFGQVISMHYRYPSGWLCQQEGLCSAEQITATPWDSMVAMVALVERSGRQPWCFSAWARRYHNCGIAPRVLPLSMP